MTRARFTLLGIGAADSPRYPPAGLLIEHGRVRIAIDGGPGTEPDAPLDAWPVTDDRAELMAAIRRNAPSLGVEPAVRDLRSGALEPGRVQHASQERSDDGDTWWPWMDVTLRKVS